MAVLIDFDEILLDPLLFMMEEGQAPFVGGPTYANVHLPNKQTGVVRTAVLRQNEIERGTFDLSLMRPEMFTYLLDTINGGYGSGVGLRVRWPHLNKVERAVIAGPGGIQIPGSGKTAFKLYKSSKRKGVTARSNVKRIVKPVVQSSKATGAALNEPDGETPRKFVGDANAPVYAAELFKIYHEVSGVETEITSGWTVDVETGIVTYSAAPAAGTTIKWSGSYDLPCAFTDNEFNLRGDVTGQAQSVGLREISNTELRIAF